MTKKLWIDKPDSKSTLKTRMHIDEGENKYHFEDIQDVAPILEMNKKEANMGADAYKVRGMQDAKMYKVASIPLIIVQQLAQKGIMSNGGQILDRPRFKKWINDPDNRHFRIYQGSI